MVASSLFLGLAGLSALFAPEESLTIMSPSQTSPLPVFVQLLGVLYLSFALMNWTAKNNIIGGIYLRPITIANFAHFSMGALTLLKYQFTGAGSFALAVMLAFYFAFAIVFAWLVFVHTGIETKIDAQDPSRL